MTETELRDHAEDILTAVVDEAMTESMERFAVQTDLFRDQFIGVLSHDLRTPLGAVTAG